MSVSLELRVAIRNLLLPISNGLEESYFEYLTVYLKALGVETDDQPLWLAMQLRLWRRTKNPSQELLALFKDVFFNPDRDPISFAFDGGSPTYIPAAQGLGESYFEIHKALCRKWLFPHDDARQLLSHSGMIVRLCVLEEMTSSEISRVIASKDVRFEFNWLAINEILRPLRLHAAMDISMVEACYHADRNAEDSLFADLNVKGAINKIGILAHELGCPGDFSSWLDDMMHDGFHPPFLLMLHYQLSTLQYYDHAVTYAYEFAPRGQAFLWLADQYSTAGIDVGKTAFLNNAKATLRLNKGWAIGRDNYKGASAMSSILLQFETLSPIAKRELAAHVRAFFHRFLRLKEAELNGQTVPDELGPLSSAQIKALVEGVAEGNTGTAGIIEQRLVDCFALAENKNEEGWRARGLGDSVFAANIPCRKLGDVELESPVDLWVEGFEAHGGALKDFYIHDHLDSFKQVLELRREDLEAVAELSEWEFYLHYVAHTSDLPDNFQNMFVITLADGLEVNVIYEQTLFGTIWMSCFDEYESIEALFAEHFTPHLNSPYISAKVRAKVKELAGE